MIISIIILSIFIFNFKGYKDMFNRDIDQSRLENGPHRFMGHDPAEHHRHPQSPPPGGPPPFGLIPPFFHSHFKFPLPLGKALFQEIRDYLILLIISEYPDGITGYQLQEKYKFPRGTLIRTLQDLEVRKYLETKDEIIDGRANKFYKITELGNSFLEELKLKWANVFGMMGEFNPPMGLKMMILEKLKEFETKDDAIDFFRGIRSWMKSMLQRIETRIEKFKKSKIDLDKIIEEIEKQDDLDREKIKQMINETIERFEEEVE
jgi:DNA-binding PadR family transcriptional regulator